MAGRVTWTDPAATDLEQTVEYLASRSPKYAGQLVRRCWATIESLKLFPDRGRPVPELDHSQLREVILDSYRLIYEIVGDELRIHGIIHGARELSSLWSEEGRPLPRRD
ncbi:MAG: type II toxin-antitoxin system RelE/ParE family toxin [Actinomycetota bacterium]